MLVASSPIVLDRPSRANPSGSLHLSPWSVFQCLSAFRTGKAAAGSSKPAPGPSGGWSGSEEPSLPPGGSNQIAASRAVCFPCGLQSHSAVRNHDSPCRNKASLAPSVPRRFGQRLRATRGICGSPSLFAMNLRGVFSDAAAGIAAVTIGLNYPFSFRGLRLQCLLCWVN
jgi:hypothetical protein